MVIERFTKQHRGSDNAIARQHRQLIGLGVAAGTFLAVAITPLAATAVRPDPASPGLPGKHSPPG